ncbi:MAG: hypothetical protein DDT19_00470 [Syntrophomonadaceae bacterium]|nr:hypothetical protein [Bacillota bacterium]
MLVKPAGCFYAQGSAAKKDFDYFQYFFLFAVTLVGRVFFLQIVTGDNYAWESVAQRSLRYDYYPTGRGQILDRNGKSLLDTHWVPVHVIFTSLADEETNDILQRHNGSSRLGQVFALSDNEKLLAKLGPSPREGVFRPSPKSATAETR